MSKRGRSRSRSPTDGKVRAVAFANTCPCTAAPAPLHGRATMSPTEKADVEALGWTEQTWQEGSLEPFHRDFVSSSLAQQAAAKALGYSAADFWCV
eukprot:COSAG01_NODE_3254_length_6349_cov_237.367520_1_plen_96_part_00